MFGQLEPLVDLSGKTTTNHADFVDDEEAHVACATSNLAILVFVVEFAFLEIAFALADFDAQKRLNGAASNAFGCCASGSCHLKPRRFAVECKECADGIDQEAFAGASRTTDKHAELVDVLNDLFFGFH